MIVKQGEMITPSLIQYNYSSLAFILGCIFYVYNNFAPKCTQMHLYFDYESCLIICFQTVAYQFHLRDISL